MPVDAAAHRTAGSRSISTPDQLQQSKRPDVPRVGAAAEPQDEPRGAEPPAEGVLGQLETERAHD